MNEPSCTSCEHIADFAGNYTECVLLHRFVDWYYWKNLSPDDCPKLNCDNEREYDCKNCDFIDWLIKEENEK